MQGTPLKVLELRQFVHVKFVFNSTKFSSNEDAKNHIAEPWVEGFFGFFCLSQHITSSNGEISCAISWWNIHLDVTFDMLNHTENQKENQQMFKKNCSKWHKDVQKTWSHLTSDPS